jgi:hypothetical protein
MSSPYWSRRGCLQTDCWYEKPEIDCSDSFDVQMHGLPAPAAPVLPTGPPKAIDKPKGINLFDTDGMKLFPTQEVKVKTEFYARFGDIAFGAGVSKGVKESRRSPTLSRGGGFPAGCRRVEHGKPGWNFRESMATPCHMPIFREIKLQNRSSVDLNVRNLFVLLSAPSNR